MKDEERKSKKLTISHELFQQIKQNIDKIFK